MAVARGWGKEGLASRKDAFALAVLVRILSSDLSLAGGVGQGKDQRLLNMLAHLLYHLLNVQKQHSQMSSPFCLLPVK